MYFAAVFGISFPGIPGAVISFSPFCLIYSLSNPPGKDASSISKTSLLKIYCEISFQILFPLIIPVNARFIASSIVDFPASLSPTTIFKPSPFGHAYI